MEITKGKIDGIEEKKENNNEKTYSINDFRRIWPE